MTYPYDRPKRSTTLIRRYRILGSHRDRDSIAYRTGYEDGSSVAREDAARWKPYNSQPRGRYDDRDHDYRREYGSKDQYKMEYTNGYRAGYESVRRGRY